MLIDCHTYLDMPQFDEDRGEVIERAREAGVQLVVSVATASPERDSVSRTLDIIARHEMVRAAIGVHPHHARAADDTFLVGLAQAVRHPRVLFWGEIGLDYHYRNSPPERQRDVFRRQLRLARESGLPLLVHCREAWADLLGILDDETDGSKYRGVLHNFTGTAEQARTCLELGFVLSFSGILTFGSSRELREVAAGLRLDQVLIETGSPYLSPAPHRGLRNEPARLPAVAEALARAMKVTPEDIARNTGHNFRRLTGEPAAAEGDVLVYPIRDRLYINLTNRCTAHCVFCRRETSPFASGYNLRLEAEHTAAEYIAAIGDPGRYAEIVFCGFGEPTLRLDALIAISKVLKRKGAVIRINTNGHGNLAHGRNIAPELAPWVDEVSISIDAPDAATYRKLVRPDFGDGTFEAVLDFVRACIGVIPRVTLTVVDVPAVDLEACRRLARSLGVELREREYQPMVGSTDFVGERQNSESRIQNPE